MSREIEKTTKIFVTHPGRYYYNMFRASNESKTYLYLSDLRATFGAYAHRVDQTYGFLNTRSFEQNEIFVEFRRCS